MAAQRVRRDQAAALSRDGPVPDERARRGPDLPAAPGDHPRAARLGEPAAVLVRPLHRAPRSAAASRPARGSASSGPRAAADQLRQMERDRDAMDSDDLDLISQFPDPRVGELLTRWDMVATPPDILVTNYSMLNVMLMREREEPLFERTAEWLARRPDARVHPRGRRAAHLPGHARQRGRTGHPQPASAARARRPTRRSCAASARAPRSSEPGPSSTSSSSSASTATPSSITAGEPRAIRRATAAARERGSPRARASAGERRLRRASSRDAATSTTSSTPSRPRASTADTPPRDARHRPSTSGCSTTRRTATSTR